MDLTTYETQSQAVRHSRIAGRERVGTSGVGEGTIRKEGFGERGVLMVINLQVDRALMHSCRPAS